MTNRLERAQNFMLIVDALFDRGYIYDMVWGGFVYNKVSGCENKGSTCEDCRVLWMEEPLRFRFPPYCINDDLIRDVAGGYDVDAEVFSGRTVCPPVQL